MTSITFDFTANISSSNCTTAITAAQVANTINEINSNKTMTMNIEFATTKGKDIVAQINNKVS
jgi:hypothetical protein